jgi:hypothetical protein|tara:strand:+ start:793 stop:1005 length:213 start_codon:yes stop_codon:yes gene_type:complete
MKELKQRLLYFARTLKEHTEYIDYNSTGHLEQSAIRTKEQTMNEIGDMLLEILELDNKTFQSWLTQEEDK